MTNVEQPPQLDLRGVLTVLTKDTTVTTRKGIIQPEEADRIFGELDSVIDRSGIEIEVGEEPAQVELVSEPARTSR